MSTIAKTGFVTTGIQTKKAEKAVTSESFWETAEQSRYGVTPMILLVVVCIGSIAAAYAGRNIPELFLIAIATTVSLTTIISVAPMKTIVGISSVAVILDILFIIASFIW